MSKRWENALDLPAGWQTEFPTKPGTYWFYGYRYGQISCGTPQEPELMLVKVRRTSNGVICTADGQFMYPKEVECPHFLKAALPTLPKLAKAEVDNG